MFGLGMECSSFAYWCVGMGLLAILQRFLPFAFFGFFVRWFQAWLERFKPFKFFRVPEFYGTDRNPQENELYQKVYTYVGTLSGAAETKFANLISPKTSNEILVSLEDGQCVEDVFLGVRVWWIHEIRENNGAGKLKSFVLKIRKKDKTGLLRPYLDHIQAVAEDAEHRGRELRLYSNGRDSWNSVGFHHPATFDTMALDLEVKNKIKADLDAFLKGKNYYHRLGRAWKRVYLFHGPPGSGKSSMVAAMANYLHYNIYDLELANVGDNSDFRMLLMQTKCKSVLVVKDVVDCSDAKIGDEDGSVERGERSNNGRVTLSGMLDLIDGLWSCCGEERIIVFITNNRKENLDPALLRPGRMDMHVNFPPCNFSAFKIMAQNYLSVKDHKHFGLVEEAFKSPGVCMTPTEVGEILLSNKSSPSRALKALVGALNHNKRKSTDSSMPVSPVGTFENEDKTSNANYGCNMGQLKVHDMVIRRSRLSQESSIMDMKRLQNLFWGNGRKSKRRWDLSSPAAEDKES